MADARPTPAPHPKGATGVVVFADGRMVWGRGFGAEGRGGRRAVLQHRHDRLPGGDDRPLLRQAGHRLHLPAHRQCRRQRRGRRGGRGARARLPGARGGDRAEQLPRRARISPAGWRKWGRIGIAGARHARADPAGAAARGRRRSPSRIAPTGSSISRRCRRWPRTGRGSRAWTSPRRSAALQVERWTGGKWALGAGLCDAAASDAERGPHVVAIDYGSKRNIFRNLVEAGARVTVVPATASFDEVMAHEPDGFFLSNGPGRPGGDRRICGAGDPGRCWRPASRCSASASATRCWRWRSAGKTVEDVPGPPRRQPPGQAPRRRPGRDHQHEPRLRGRARGLARQCARDARVAVRRQQLRASS